MMLGYNGNESFLNFKSIYNSQDKDERSEIMAHERYLYQPSRETLVNADLMLIDPGRNPVARAGPSTAHGTGA